MTDSHTTAEIPGLLVSVRSPVEALDALRGGAAIIDVKEPANGALGRATDAVITGVVTAVDGRARVSAAMGELLDDRDAVVPPQLAFVKWGLAGCGYSIGWRQRLQARRSLGPEVVAVAYADWQCAHAPSVDDVFKFAAEYPGSVLLLDTHCKEAATRDGARPTLLDWLRPAQIYDLCERGRAAGVRLALAGSLGIAEIAELTPARPHWFAVRGAACKGGREGAVNVAKVAELVCVIKQHWYLAG